MKDTAARKGAYMGAGVGIVLFAIFGLMPGSFLGGVMGLNVAQWMFGSPLGTGILSRMIVAASMMMGVLVAGITFVAGSSTLGWLLGMVFDSARGNVHDAAGAHR